MSATRRMSENRRPAFADVELADQVEQARGSGVDMGGELRDGPVGRHRPGG